MSYFLWTADLATGNKFLDAEHRKMTILIDGLLAASERGASVDTVSLQLDHLIEFARAHFDRENCEMLLISFRDRVRHAAEHTKLLDQVNALKAQIGSGQQISQLEVYDFLRTWLRDHIVNFDMPLSATEKTFGRNLH